MPDLNVVDLGNLAADGSTPAKQINGSHRNPTGSVNVRSTGDFGGGTLQYEGSLDGTSWYSLGASASLDAAGGAELFVLIGEYIRATLSGATDPDIDSSIALAGSNLV